MDNEKLVELYQGGDKGALEELISLNTGIVYKIASKYKDVNRRCDISETEIIEDLMQSGKLGLIKAVKRYDLNKKYKAKFITYAVYWINREIYQYVNGVGEKEQKNNNFYSRCKSVNVIVGEEEGTELLDFIEGVDYEFENTMEKEFIRELRIQLNELMEDNLTLREREVLEFKYGWNSEEMTLKEIGGIFNISRERTRQIEVNSLIKLRKSSWVAKNAREFMELGYISKRYIEIFKSRGIPLN